MFWRSLPQSRVWPSVVVRRHRAWVTPREASPTLPPPVSRSLRARSTIPVARGTVWRTPYRLIDLIYHASPQASGQSRRDELFGGRRDVESGEVTERSAEAKLDEADQYQDKTEAAYKVRCV